MVVVATGWKHYMIDQEYLLINEIRELITGATPFFLSFYGLEERANRASTERIPNFQEQWYC